MNAILCLLLGHRREKQMSCHTFYDGIQDRYYTRYETYYVCDRCGDKLLLEFRCRRGAEQ